MVWRAAATPLLLGPLTAGEATGLLDDLSPYLDLGATGLLIGFLAWFLRAVARGDWVSKRELDYVRADRDARVAEKTAEAEAWKAVATTERAGREIAMDQNRELVTGFHTLDRFFDALRQVAGEKDHRHVDP